MTARKKSTGLARFITTTLFITALAMVVVVYGPSLLEYFPFSTPNYRAFGVLVPNGYTITGIDVSRYQGRVDWEKVKKMRSGKLKVNFVFIKCTEGLNYEDPYCERNQKQCKKQDIAFGGYHYFLPTVDATKQADFFLSKYNPKKGNLPPVADIESTGNLNRETVRKNLKTFLKRIEQKTGVKPIIYSYHNFYLNYLSDGFEEYSIWLAHYGPGNPHGQPWTFWQFSEQSTISGIKHNVDLNVFKGDSLAFEKIKVK